MIEKPSILIVDNDASLRKTLSEILKAKEYIPVTAATAKQALDMVEKHMPDVVLIDLKLEDMYGLDIMLKIKECRPATECIILTAHVSKESVIQAVKMGAYSYIQKPYDIDQLLVMIRAAVDKLRTEKELRKSEKKYRSILETISEGYCLLNSENRIVEVNKAFCNMLGYHQDEMIGKTPSEFADHENQKIFMEQASKESTTTHHGYEITLKKKNGQDLNTYFNSTTVRDKSGEITNFVSIDRDRTHEIELEKQLIQAQKMETIGTLAGGIAHDFNNILTSVIGFSELALNDAEKGSQQYENLQEVITAGNRAVDLVKQILTFSRQTDQKKKPVQVKCILEEALKLIRSSIPTTIKIKQNIQSDALVMGESNHIHQVLINLCANAAYAMEDTGGVLTVDLLDMEFNSNFVSNYPDLPPGRYLNLTVTDTGCGMTPDVLDKIFDPFFTTKQKEEGTGMGLSVVHGIVRSHGGHIYTHSEPGQGSTFNIFLPAIYKQLKPDDSVDKPVLTGTERILLVDDEPAIVNMSKQLIESLGYDVVTRTSSIEALEFFRRQPESVDLVITDMTMPNMAGDELAVELMKIRPDIPVILCTGFSTRINEQKSKAKGIRAFVLKPIIKQKLSETIRKVLE